jgi:hypothetical protein
MMEDCYFRFQNQKRENKFKEAKKLKTRPAKWRNTPVLVPT